MSSASVRVLINYRFDIRANYQIIAILLLVLSDLRQVPLSKQRALLMLNNSIKSL